MNRHIARFLDLRCAGDVLNAVAPLNNAAKEITESMAMLRRLRPFFLDSPMQFALVDACAGNALTAVLAAHVLPITRVVAVDKKERHRQGYRRIRRFNYVNHALGCCAVDMAVIHPYTQGAHYVLSATHPCKTARYLVELYQADPACLGLVIMACCCGNRPTAVPQDVIKRIGKYQAWALSLAIAAGGTYYVDRHCLSPCNAIIVARKDA